MEYHTPEARQRRLVVSYHEAYVVRMAVGNCLWHGAVEVGGVPVSFLCIM